VGPHGCDSAHHRSSRVVLGAGHCLSRVMVGVGLHWLRVVVGASCHSSRVLLGTCGHSSMSSMVVGVRNCPKKEPLMHLKVRRRCGGGRGQR